MTAGLGVTVGAPLLRLAGHALVAASNEVITAQGLDFVLLAALMVQPLVQVAAAAPICWGELIAR